MWRLARLSYLGLALVLAVHHRGQAGDERAVLKDGTSVSGRLVGTAATGFLWESAEQLQRIPLDSIARVTMNPALRRVSTAGPLRRVILSGGEALHAEALLRDDGITSIWRSGLEPVKLLPGAVTGVSSSIGEVTAIYEDFERERCAVVSEKGALVLDRERHRSGDRSLLVSDSLSPCSVMLAEPVTAGRLEWSLYDDGRQSPQARYWLDVQFRSPDGEKSLRISPGWDGESYCEVPAGTEVALQAQKRSVGWHDWTVAFDEHRFVVLVDDALLARGLALGEVLTSLRISAGKTGRAAAGENPARTEPLRAWIDDLRITRQIDVLARPARTQRQGSVWLVSGDEVFGDPLQFDAHEVTQQRATGKRTWLWENLRGLDLPAAPAPAAAPVSGWIAEIELAPILYSARDEPDRLVAAMVSLDERELTAMHPWLGTLRLPRAEVSSIRPLFTGTLQLVDPALHHLGDSIREDLQAKLPEGTRWEATVALTAPPAKKAWVSLLAAELEPAAALQRVSPAQPPARQAAFLSTDLIVNGRRIDSLNGQVTLRARSSNPQRLRLAIPDALLKAGVNTIRLEQRPARDDPREFDDFEFSRLSLEFEP